MKIYDITKTTEITDYTPEKGTLAPDKLLVAHHDAIPAKTVEEQVAELVAQGKTITDGKNEDGTPNGKKYQVIKVYPNGGKRVEEVKEIPAVDAWDEYEDIQVFTPFTAEEIAENEAKKAIATAKAYLAKTDYIVMKLAEATADGDAEAVNAIRTEYETELAERKAARATVNEKEATLMALEKA